MERCENNHSLSFLTSLNVGKKLTVNNFINLETMKTKIKKRNFITIRISEDYANIYINGDLLETLVFSAKDKLDLNELGDGEFALILLNSIKEKYPNIKAQPYTAAYLNTDLQKFKNV